MGPHDPVLIVEDGEDDYFLTQRAFSKAGIKNPLIRCADGQDALDFLRRDGAHVGSRAAMPCIVLLDLNMPGLDGREVLAEMKADPKLRKIPVIVLTTSTHHEDVETCYALGANSYLRKPLAARTFFDMIDRLARYWLDVAELPVPA